jgi:signal transduction histidine kinase
MKTTCRSPIPGDELHFSVRDTGIGIPADRVDRFSDLLARVDASTTRRYGGFTGWGWPIVSA